MAERILMLATSAPNNVRGAMGVLRGKLFPEAQFDLLCTLADLPSYRKDDLFRERLIFPSRRDPWAIYQLRRRIGREGYQAVAVLWCKEPARYRPKLFSLACGLRHLIIFNENLDCNYFRPGLLLRLVRARWGQHSPARYLPWALLKTGLQKSLFPLRILFLFFQVSGLYLRRYGRR